MLSYISNHLRLLSGFIGYIEIDKELRLVENTTLFGDDKAMELSSYFIHLLLAYQGAGRTIKTIAVACGTSVYVSLNLPNGYLIVQMERLGKLAGMRRALNSIINEANFEGPAVTVTDLPVQVPATEKPEIIEAPPKITHSVWPEFSQDFLKILSPIAPENILKRLIATAFKKSGIEESPQLDSLLISRIVKATLSEIPNAARRKSAEAEVNKLLKKYSI